MRLQKFARILRNIILIFQCANLQSIIVDQRGTVCTCVDCRYRFVKLFVYFFITSQAFTHFTDGLRHERFSFASQNIYIMFNENKTYFSYFATHILLIGPLHFWHLKDLSTVNAITFVRKFLPACVTYPTHSVPYGRLRILNGHEFYRSIQKAFISYEKDTFYVRPTYFALLAPNEENK